MHYIAYWGPQRQGSVGGQTPSAGPDHPSLDPTLRLFSEQSGKVKK